MSETFPALLFKISKLPETSHSYRRLTAMVEEGQPLRRIATAAGIPFWMRHLPPQAFEDESAFTLPVSPRFSKRIVNHLPAHEEESRAWLAAVAFAARACHEHFALWLARQPVFKSQAEPEQRFALLAAYAWHSDQTSGAPRRLIWRPWRPDMSLATAIFETASWLNRILLVVQSSAEPHRAPWLASATVQGFDFVPLLSATDILDEARAQNHCADQLGLLVACGHAALYSIRHNNQRIATMQLCISANPGAGYAIGEIKCRHNANAPQQIWQAAREFVTAAGPCTNDAPTYKMAPAWPRDNEAWAQLIANYRAASANAFPLPEIFSFRDYAALRDSLAQLAAEQGLGHLFSSDHGPFHRP